MTFRQTACFTPAGQHKHEKHFILNKWLRRSLRHLVHNEYRSQSVRYLVFQHEFDYKKSAEISLRTVFLRNDSPVKRTLIALPHQLSALFHTAVYLSPVNAPLTLPLRY